MPCHETAVALTTAPTSPIATIGHAGPKAPVAATPAAMPSASPAITKRGAT